MEAKRFGVQIQRGLRHWAILQRKGNFGSIELSGIWSALPGAGDELASVYTRVVKEDGSGDIVPWRRCATDRNGEWNTAIRDIPTGGLYRIETCLRVGDRQPIELATRGDMIHHVVVGDIWVIAGQSNAAGYGRGAVNDPPEMGVHLLRHNGQWDLATHPLNESTGTVQALNGEPVNPGHSPYLAFAKEIKKETGVPIGLLQTALGGSPLSRWNPDENGDLYRNMMDVIRSAGGQVKGMLWYQGCSDCDPENAPTYLSRFSRMVERWREDMSDNDLSVLTVQLNRNASSEEGDEADCWWGEVREAQRTAAMTLSRVYVVPSLDSPLSDIIHNCPAGNLLIGGRLAKAALAADYGKTAAYRAPNIVQAAYDPESHDGTPTILLMFADVTGELFAVGNREPVFTVEDGQGKAPITRWRITDKIKVELELSRPLEGAAVVHGAYETNPSAFPVLDTGTHMPMLSFYGYKIKQEKR
ncbi:sialate O-acetylesterase [Cohnella soli]|uniref:Sialate O-acetylesterase n=1 Tax=Cohnella soli TaxID=425005 RepID=A0ABW0HVF2_9BACL